MKLQRLPTVDTTQTIDDAVEQFMLHQKACRHTDRTLENHRYTLGKFQQWAKQHSVENLQDVDPQTLRLFFTELQDASTPNGSTIRAGTVATVFKNVRAFFNFHEAEENIASNPMRRLKPPKQDKTILPAFTPEEIKILEAETSGRDSVSVRNRALLYFMLDSGCRLSETANLRIEDVDTRTGMVRVLQGKGRKDRMTRIGANTLKALNKYLRIRGGKDSDPLWLGTRGAMTEAGIAITLEKLGKRCGVHSNAHKFRRTTALTMLRNGCDIYSLQSLLGHADLQVLRRYLAQTESDIARAHERFSPVDNLR